MRGESGIEHSVIGFYCCAISGKVTSDLYQQTLQWFRRLGCKPSLMGTRFDKGRLIRFRNSEAKLAKYDFSEAIEFQIISLPPDAKNELEGDDLNVVFSARDQTLAISSRSTIASLANESLLKVAKEAISILSPEYGIGFRRDERRGPTLYVGGTNCGFSAEEDEREGRQIGGWRWYGLDRKIWRQGILRDVYPWNFLSGTQLTAKINDQSVANWIQETPERGTLTPVADHMLLWEVSESFLPVARRALNDAGILFDYERQKARLSTVPDSALTGKEVLGQLLGSKGGKDVKVIHVDKTGLQPQVRELDTDEFK